VQAVGVRGGSLTRNYLERIREAPVAVGKQGIKSFSNGLQKSRPSDLSGERS